MPNRKCEKSKVLIVDDHPAVREALAVRFSNLPDFVVCGEAADVGDALTLIADTKPHLAIIDIRLKTGDGLDLIKRIRARGETVRILVWSMFNENHYAERALRARAQGYITKEHATGQIVEASRLILAGQVYLSPEFSATLLHRTIGKGGTTLDHSPIDALSDRELEVLRLIGQGVKTSTIAEQLHLSIKTIETYRQRIRQKLDLKDGMELATAATQWIMTTK